MDVRVRGFFVPDSPKSLMMRSVCFAHVALIRVAVDASVIITSSSRFLYLRCVPAQKSAIQRGELRRLGILLCAKLFKVCFTDVDIVGSGSGSRRSWSVNRTRLC